MKKLILFLGVAAAVLAPSAQAAWFGSPGSALSYNRSSIQATYDTGSRSIEPKDGGTSFDMDTDRFYVQYGRGFGGGLDLFGRLMPQTGDASFENRGYNPSIWGLGGGLHWAPPQSGRVRWGGQVSLDWDQGKDQGTTLKVLETVLAGGASYRPHKNVDVYGGVSFMKSDVTFKNGSNTSKFELSDNFGLFAGVGVNPAPALTLAFELHVINETVFGFNAAYRFGGEASPQHTRTSRHHRRDKK